MNLAQMKIETAVGTMFAISSEKGLRSLHFGKADIPLPIPNSRQDKILLALADQLAAYFSGNLKKFDLALDLKGTEFQIKVWKKLLEVPFGQTISYLELAKSLGTPQASRAVGGANGKNLLWLIVPCHRVINSNGGLGGYAGGLQMKNFLLNLEKLPGQCRLSRQES